MKTIRFKRFKRPALSLLTTVFIVVLCDRTLAQNRITPDNSLGRERSRLVRRAEKPNVDLILGGAKRGKLLFHSFDDFNVEQGGEATFANPRGVSNIFTRVTGPLETNILGTLGVDGKANLFLLNPNGIFFGPQSKLNIAGSFFASTASALDLGDGATFRADTSEVPNLLTLRVPIGVQFGEAPGEIVSEGQLQTGRDLTLTGDRLSVSGELLAGRDLSLQGNEVLILENNLSFIGRAVRSFEIDGFDISTVNRFDQNDSLFQPIVISAFTPISRNNALSQPSFLIAIPRSRENEEAILRRALEIFNLFPNNIYSKSTIFLADIEILIKCQSGGKSNFINIQKGGMETKLDDNLPNLWDDLRFNAPIELTKSIPGEIHQPSQLQSTEATEWVKGPDNHIQLLDLHSTPLAIASNHNSCKMN